MPISPISETPPAPVYRNCRSTRRYGNDHHGIRDPLVVREVRPCVGNAQGQAPRESIKCANRVFVTLMFRYSRIPPSRSHL